ncbi:hypothetical protein [Mycolicibacterium poriferae]|uniref:hypothetical protein n=1 Tax=Mycolicibacterium poriferae TaxID=39694 RepID=UPI0024BBD19D|nr:hypothetical protein [Mycolicibacterium poriferae]
MTQQTAAANPAAADTRGASPAAAIVAQARAEHAARRAAAAVSPEQRAAIDALLNARRPTIAGWLDLIERLGIVPVRVWATAKATVQRGWQNTTAWDRAAIETWLEQSGNIGALLGASRLIAWEADNAAGTEALRDAGMRLYTVSAGSQNPSSAHPGGVHVLWRVPACWPDDVVLTGSTKAVRLPNGGLVDVLAGAHQLVMPPSVVVTTTDPFHVGAYMTASQAGYCTAERDGWLQAAAAGAIPELPLWAWPEEMLAHAPTGADRGEAIPGLEALVGVVRPKPPAVEREPHDEDDELTAAVDQLPFLDMLADAGVVGHRVGFDGCGPCEMWLRAGSSSAKSITVHDCAEHGGRVQVWTTALPLAAGGYSRLDAYCGLTGRDRADVMREHGLLTERAPLGVVDAAFYERLAATAEADAAAGRLRVATAGEGGTTEWKKVSRDALLARAAGYRSAAAAMRAEAATRPAPRGEVVTTGRVAGGLASVTPIQPVAGTPQLAEVPVPAEPERTPEERAAAEAEAAAEAVAAQRDPYGHLPDPCALDIERAVFDDPRFPQVGRIRDVARAGAISPWTVLGLAIGRGLLRVSPDVQLPALVGGLPAPLNMQIGIVGASGRGKGAANGMVTYDAQLESQLGCDFDRTFMPPSGAALAGLFVGLQKEDGKPVIVQNRECAWCDWSEVDTLTATAGRGGNDLAPELRAAVTGAALGTDPKGEGATPLKVAARTYRILITFATQFGKPAAALLVERDGGTLQRTLWFSTTDPRSLTRRPRGAATRLDLSIRRQVPGGLITIDDEICDEIWEAQAGKIRFDRDADEQLAHQNLTRLRIATWLVLIQPDGGTHIGAAEWEWAGHVIEHSRRVRDRLEASVDQLKRTAAIESGNLDFDRRNAAEAARVAHTEKLLESLAAWGRDVRAGRNAFGRRNGGGRFTLRDIRASAKGKASERYTRAAELAMELVNRGLWACDATGFWSVEPDPEPEA